MAAMTEAEDATLLKAATRQRDWEHLSVCDNDLWSVVMSYESVQ
jgi:hypothetical protein